MAENRPVRPKSRISLFCALLVNSRALPQPRDPGRNDGQYEGLSLKDSSSSEEPSLLDGTECFF